MDATKTTEAREARPAPPADGAWWRSAWFGAAVLTLAVWLTFGHTLGNELVFDDLDVIKHNRAIRSLGNLGILFSKEYFRASGEYTYRPVATFSYFLDYAVGGGRPWVYHLHNVLLHNLNVLLVFALFNLLGAGRWRAFAIAAVFALHPLAAEAVIFPGFREDLQMTAGALAMAYCLAADRLRPSGGWLVGAGAALAYALFAKEGALLVPLAWWIFDLLYDKPPGLRPGFARRYALPAAVAAFYVGARFFALANPEAAQMDVVEHIGLGQRLLTAPYLFAYYLRRFLWPVPLCIIHEVEPLQAAGAAFWGALLAAAAFAALWIGISRRQSWLWAAGLWAGATFAPVANLYPIANLWAERFYYSVNVGTAAVAVAAVGAGWAFLRDRAGPERRRAMKVFAAVLIAVVAWAAAVYDVARVLECRSSLSLWRATARRVPTNGVALKTLAIYELEAGNYARAEKLARQAEGREGGGVYAANYILGQSAMRQKDWNRAIAHFRKALSVPPPSAASRTSLLLSLASAYLRIGRADRAAAIAREVLRTDPTNRAAQHLLGAAKRRRPTAESPTTAPLGVKTP